MLLKSSRALVLALPIIFLMACSNEPGFEVLDAKPAKLLSEKRLVIINYWATWCLPCLEEMPELAAFREKHKDRVEVYAVNYDRPGIDQLRMEVTDLGVKIPALVTDPNERLGYERPMVLPTTIAMRAGQVQEVLVGPQTMETLESILEKWEQ